MNQDDDYKLDNPIWYALNETHKQYAVEFNSCKFYKPEYSPFGGMGKGGDTSLATDQYSKLTSLFYMVGDPPIAGSSARIKKTTDCQSNDSLQTLCIRNHRNDCKA